MCGGFHGVPVGMPPGVSPKNSRPGVHREDLLPHTTESYGGQPKRWLNNVIKGFSISFLPSSVSLHPNGDHSRFSHHIKLRKKAVSFPVPHFISEENLSPKTSSNFLFIFHWAELGLMPSPHQFLAGECNHHCWLRLIRICPSYNGEDEKMSEPHQGSGLWDRKRATGRASNSMCYTEFQQ